MPDSPSVRFSHMGSNIEVPVIVDLMARALANPDLLSLAAGFTDNAALPKELVGQLAAEITQGDAAESLQYGQNQGRLRLRELACRNVFSHPRENEGRFDPEQTMITNGSQQALYLAAQTLCDPGDIILVQEPSYFVCLEMLKGLGIRAVGIPCDSSGAILEDGFSEKLRDLEMAGERDRIKGVYLVSFFCNPSSRSLELEEKLGVARALKGADILVPIIEDAAYRDLFFDEPHPIPSIISLPAFSEFPLLYLGTFTKPFATGLKIGYGYCTHPKWLEKMLCIKGHQDFGSAHFNQCLIERALESDRYEAHLSQTRSHYAAKSKLMEAALLEGGLQNHGWEWHKPEGGLIYWLRGPEAADLRMNQTFCEKCIEQGVLYVPGDLCFADGNPWNCLRLSFGALDGEKLPEAVSRFAQEAVKLG